MSWNKEKENPLRQTLSTMEKYVIEVWDQPPHQLCHGTAYEEIGGTEIVALENMASEKCHLENITWKKWHYANLEKNMAPEKTRYYWLKFSYR